MATVVITVTDSDEDGKVDVRCESDPPFNQDNLSGAQRAALSMLYYATDGETDGITAE